MNNDDLDDRTTQNASSGTNPNPTTDIVENTKTYDASNTDSKSDKTAIPANTIHPAVVPSLLLSGILSIILAIVEYNRDYNGVGDALSSALAFFILVPTGVVLLMTGLIIWVITKLKR